MLQVFDRSEDRDRETAGEAETLRGRQLLRTVLVRKTLLHRAVHRTALHGAL